MAERTFAELASISASRKGRCPRCGSQHLSGSVSVVVRSYGPPSPNPLKGGKQVATRSRSFCESCAIEVYEALFAILSAAGGGDA